MPAPHPDDIVDEAKLERALKRLGFTVTEAAQLVGVPAHSFSMSMGYAPRGWRQRLENALDLEAGALRF